MPGAKGLDRKSIENHAESILRDLGLYRLPVDPFEIARKERIKLAPGDYDGCFDGRLEYHAAKRKFLLFYADERTGNTEGRVRFTIGHELGHYYLCEHHQYLTSGIWHGSHTGFVSDNRLEREADLFSAALLMPEELYRTAVRNYRQSVCSLSELMTLADRMKVSVTASAIRYCNLDIEASGVILSRNGRVLFHLPSYSMERRGYSYIAKGSAVPSSSATHELIEDPSEERAEGERDAGIWYEDRDGDLWEEAARLGNTGLIITYLVPQDDGEDEDDD